MTKKRVSEVNKAEDKIRKAFWEDVKTAEEKHGVMLGAFLDYTQSGIIPVIGAKIVEKKAVVTKQQDETTEE